MKGTWDYYSDYYTPGPAAAPGVYKSENLKDNLREIIDKLELTQDEAAKRCDLSQPLIHQYLTGNVEPTIYSFCQLCAGLGVEPNWLLSKHEKIK